MSVDLNLPIGTFLRLSISQYRQTLNGTELSAKMLDEALEKAATAWIAHRKPRKQPEVVSSEAKAIYTLYPRHVGRESALRAILKALQRIPGDVLTERVKSYAAVANRYTKEDREFIPHPATWFNEARYDDDPREWERSNMRSPAAVPAVPNPGPPGWLAWARENIPGWRRFAEEAQGSPIPPWDKLESTERNAILSQMKEAK